MADTGNKLPPVSSAEAKRREQQRVKALIERDRQDRMREIERAAAEIKVREGLVVTAHETVVEPTPEWFQHGDAESFTPELPDGTVREIKSVRRVNCPMILRMLRGGNLENEQYQALRFYAETYEIAGLHGSIPIAQIGREVFGGSHDKVMFTEAQQQAQKALREMKAVIPKHQVRFFEAVVIKNVPVRRAAQFMRTRRSNALNDLHKIADAMVPIAKNLGGVE